VPGTGVKEPACYVSCVTLLSDRARPIVLLVALAGILWVMLWFADATATGRLGVVTVLDEPVGSDVVLSLVGVRSLDGPDRYTVGHAALQIPVVGPTEGLRAGEDVTIGGVVDDGFIRARWVEHAPARPAKRRLGLIGLGVAGVVFLGAVRVGRGGLAVRG
jgi:hypothetical protein